MASSCFTPSQPLLNQLPLGSVVLWTCGLTPNSRWPHDEPGFTVWMVVTPETLQDRWFTRDRPILVAAVRRLDAGEQPVHSTVLAADLELKDSAVIQAMTALSPSYLVTRSLDAWGGPVAVNAVGLTERGRRAVGLWPSADAVDGLEEALRQAEEATEDPEERTAIRRAIGAVGSVSRDVMVDVMGAVIARQSGMG